MGKPRLPPDKRGLGHAHRRRRAALLAALIDGSPCPYCHQPMWKLTQPLDLDHSLPRAIATNSVGDRMAHRSCNRRAGQKLGQLRKGAPIVRPASRAW